MKRILSLYIIREIAGIFVLALVVFTLVLLMGRLVKLTEMVLSNGVPLGYVAQMMISLLPSFFVYTIPMAFLLATLLSFSRISSDNEFTVMKACGVSLAQVMPPVLVCGFVASLLGLYVGVNGVPWGNRTFADLSFSALQQNITATIREKVFWDDIPGIILYTDHYDEKRRSLSDVLIYDGREPARPLTIFAGTGVIGGVENSRDSRLILKNGSIHVKGIQSEYRLIDFQEYIMTLSAPGMGTVKRSPKDMDNAELRKHMNSQNTSQRQRLKMADELHSRFALPFASMVFAVIAVPLGLQNRRSAKSFGFSISLAVFLVYYALLSFMTALAERGVFSMALALWLPNVIFFAAGCLLLRMVSQERRIPFPSVETLTAFFRKAS